MPHISSFAVTVCLSVALGVVIGNFMSMSVLPNPSAPIINSERVDPLKATEEKYRMPEKGSRNNKRKGAAKPFSESSLLYTLSDVAMQSYRDKKSVHRAATDNYCQRVASYRSRTPKEYFPRLLHSDLPDGLLPKEVLRSLGWVDPHKHPSNDGWRHAHPGAQLFWFAKTYLYSRYNVDFPCKGQVAKFLPGCEYAGSKAELAFRLREYSERFPEKYTSCFVHDRMHPMSYRLNRYDECTKWTKVVRSEEQSRKQAKRKTINPAHVGWILKVGEGVQNAKGLTILNYTDAEAMAQTYADSKTCRRDHGKFNKNVIAQRYIRNPLLVNGKKIDFRVYLFVASAEPLLVYFFPGFIRKAASLYVHTADNPNAHYSNIARAKQDKRYNTDAKFRHSHVMSMEELQTYLNLKGYTRNPNYVTETLKPQMKEYMVHIMNAVDKDIEKHHGRFGLWGLDFMLDTDMNLWFLEVNTAPNVNTGGGNPRTTGLKYRLLKELFEIEEVIARDGVNGLANMKHIHMEPILYRSYFRKTLNEKNSFWAHNSSYFGNVARRCINPMNEVVTKSLNAEDGRGGYGRMGKRTKPFPKQPMVRKMPEKIKNPSAPKPPPKQPKKAQPKKSDKKAAPEKVLTDENLDPEDLKELETELKAMDPSLGIDEANPPAGYKTVYLRAYGEVQGVMFRQTIIRAAKRLSLIAGATNESVPDGDEVTITLYGREAQVEQLVELLDRFRRDKLPLNSWGARLYRTAHEPSGHRITAHQVTTENVDSFKWSKDVKFFFA